MIIQFFLGEEQATPEPSPAPSQFESPQLAATRAFLTDLLARRGTYTVGHQNPRLYLEGTSAKFVPVTAFEPDPVTCRSKYYYNSVENTLYQRIFVADKPKIGKLVAVWKRI